MVNGENSIQTSDIGNTRVFDNLRSQSIASALTQHQSDISSAFDQEVSQHLLMTKNAAAFSEVNALIFWKHNLQFPLLAKIALVYLAVSS